MSDEDRVDRGLEEMGECLLRQWRHTHEVRRVEQEVLRDIEQKEAQIAAQGGREAIARRFRDDAWNAWLDLVGHLRSKRGSIESAEGYALAVLEGYDNFSSADMFLPRHYDRAVTARCAELAAASRVLVAGGVEAEAAQYLSAARQALERYFWC